MTTKRNTPVSMKKTRPVENPYEVRKYGDWEWRVLKSSHNDMSNPNARAFCAVRSPYTMGGYDYGDVWWSEIVNIPIVETNY